MSKYKTEFELETLANSRMEGSGKIEIIGTSPKNEVYVTIDIPNVSYHYIKDKDLERFAVNILRAIGSKKLKQ